MESKSLELTRDTLKIKDIKAIQEMYVTKQLSYVRLNMVCRVIKKLNME